MFRKLFNNVLETVLQSPESSLYPAPFTKLETMHFSWLSSVAPCFPVNASNISILSDPQQFYDTIKEGCRTAQKRIILVSLYLGNSSLERSLVETVLNNENFIRGDLNVDVLLDYTRGSRFENNSRTMLQPLLQTTTSRNNCKVSLYHTPVLRGFIKKLAPNRWNELFGLQHMKLYIFDDTLVISGANLSNDYFTNRQDRYFVIKDKKLCNFYSGLVSKVQKFSLRMDQHNNVGLEQDWKPLPYEGNKEEFIRKAQNSIQGYIDETKDDRNHHKEEGFDTWVFPLVQMGQLGVEQDALVTERIFAEAPNDSRLQIATGYFNLTSQYKETLIRKSRADCRILMAHPKANGFLGAAGAAGGIPAAYSLIAREFEGKFLKCNQDYRIHLLEYLRENWTYHAKGLWYYPPKSDYPCLTLVGSPNFGERSVKKDLETQLAVVTENPDLRKRLHAECQRIYKFGIPAETHREAPSWVRAFVFFFRNYF